MLDSYDRNGRLRPPYMNFPKTERQKPFVYNSPITSVNEIESDIATRDHGAPAHPVGQNNHIGQRCDRDAHASPLLDFLSLPNNSHLTGTPADTVSRLAGFLRGCRVGLECTVTLTQSLIAKHQSYDLLAMEEVPAFSMAEIEGWATVSGEIGSALAFTWFHDSTYPLQPGYAPADVVNS